MEIPNLTREHLVALVDRADLLGDECRLKQEHGLNWHGRAQQLHGFGRAGGSAMDRRHVAEAMEILEAAR